MTSPCYACGFPIEVSEKVLRKDECPECGVSLHCCRMCSFYDPNAYNSCRENQAERVVDKEQANYCDYFKLSNRQDQPIERIKALKDLDDLFK
jgi:hypothetical protein